MPKNFLFVNSVRVYVKSLLPHPALQELKKQTTGTCTDRKKLPVQNRNVKLGVPLHLPVVLTN